MTAAMVFRLASFKYSLYIVTNFHTDISHPVAWAGMNPEYYILNKAAVLNLLLVGISYSELILVYI